MWAKMHDEGGVYLPEEDLRQFGLTPDDILNASEPDDRFRALMQFEIDRAKRLYEESWKGIALLPSDCHFAVGGGGMGVSRHS